MGNKLCKTAQEIRSRPYSYKDTPQLDLDSFLNFCMSAKISVSAYTACVEYYDVDNLNLIAAWLSCLASPTQAKLVSVSISPAMVGFGFFMLGIVLFLVFQFDEYSWAPWL